MLEFKDLIGKTFRSLEIGDDHIYLHMENDESFEILHIQDCCEVVKLEFVTPDTDVAGRRVVATMEEYESDWEEDAYDSGHYTWTKYLITLDDSRSIQFVWHGRSNGYYSEVPTFQRPHRPIRS